MCNSLQETLVSPLSIETRNDYLCVLQLLIGQDASCPNPRGIIVWSIYIELHTSE